MNKMLIHKEKAKAILTILKDCKDHKNIKCLHLDEKNLVCTNSTLMLIIRRYCIETKDIIPGNYKILSTLKHNKIFDEFIIEPIDVQYPDYTLHIPATSKQIDQFQIDISDDLKRSESIIKLYVKTNNGYNIDYLKTFAPIGSFWTVNPSGQDKPIRMDCTNTQAVILPFKLMI